MQHVAMQKIEQRPIQSGKKLQQKIRNLVNKKVLNIKHSKTRHLNYQYDDVTVQNFNDPNIKKMIDVGKNCKGIVVKKNQSSKQLWIHLTKMVSLEPQSKYLTLTSSNSNTKHKEREQRLIHQFRQFAFIKDYDIKQPFSIFTYINSYKDIQVGSEVFGILLRKEKRSFNTDGQTNQNSENNIWFQISIKNQMPNIKKSGRNAFSLYGINWDQRFRETVDEKYEKYKNFSISKLSLYSNGFENDDTIQRLKEKVEIELNQNINPISNIKHLKHMHINFQRIRQVQEKKWASQHFSEGMEFLKRGNNQYAIQNFDVAKKFDKSNEKIYIGKGCALANMNNFSQGLREIKQALKINPASEQANQYYKTIRQKLRQKQVIPEPKKKNSSGSSPRTYSK